MWTCPKCQSQVDATFDVCWQCGTSKDGVEDPSFVRADDAAPVGSPLDPQIPIGANPPGVVADLDGAELVECYWALDLMQARFLADQLIAAGIPALSDDHDLHDTLGSMSSVPRIRVRAEDLPRARAWLEDYERQHKANHPGPE